MTTSYSIKHLTNLLNNLQQTHIDSKQLQELIVSSTDDKRAKIVADKIIANGVTAANIASEGYGSDHPVCAANDTPECKAQNRRVDIRVTKK